MTHFSIFDENVRKKLLYGCKVKALYSIPLEFLNPIGTGGGGFHLLRSFLPITLKVVQLHTRNFVTFPRI